MGKQTEAMAQALDVVATAVDKASLNPEIGAITLQNRKEITAAIAPTMAKVLVNSTNSEPWYQSRVYWGLIITGASTIAKPFLGDAFELDSAQALEYANALATAGQAFGLLLSWYGRYRAAKLKPLGS